MKRTFKLWSWRGHASYRQLPPENVVGYALILMPLAVALTITLWAGSFARYMADDFAYASDLAQRGFLPDQIAWYVAWSGRFSSTLVSSLAELGGPQDIGLVMGSIVVLWGTALAWAFSRVARRVGVPYLVGILPASLILVATFSATPDLAQSLYWQMGLLSYVAPLALGTLAIAIASAPRIRTRLSCVDALNCATLMFAAGGFSETYVITQTVALAIAFVYAVCHHGRPYAGVLGIGLLGSMLALGVVAAAPGNAVRRAHLPPHPTATTIFTHTIHDTVAFLTALMPILLICTIVSAALSSYLPNSVRLSPMSAVVGCVGGVVIVSVCFGSAWYAQADTTPPRALIIPTYLLVCIAVATGTTIHMSAKRYRAGIAAAGVILLCLVSLARTADWVHTAAPYAIAWDRRDALLRHAIGGVATVTPLNNPAALAEVRNGPDQWIIPSVAAYYHLHRIVVVDSHN